MLQKACARKSYQEEAHLRERKFIHINGLGRRVTHSRRISNVPPIVHRLMLSGGKQRLTFNDLRLIVKGLSAAPPTNVVMHGDHPTALKHGVQAQG